MAWLSLDRYTFAVSFIVDLQITQSLCFSFLIILWDITYSLSLLFNNAIIRFVSNE